MFDAIVVGAPPRGNQEDTDRLFGMIENSVPVAEFFSPENVGRIMARAGAA